MERNEKTMTLNAGKHKVFTTKNMILIAMFGAISMALMVVDFPLPFAPAFLKFDFADLPAMLATFLLGPIEGILVCVVKLALKLIIKGTETAFVGEVANLIAAAAYMLPAALIYRYKRTKAGAAFSLLIGTLCVSIICVFSNMFLIFPAYSKLYGIPMDAIIGMGHAVNSHINSLFSLMLLSVLPFNLFKFGIISVITFLVYKRMKHLIFRK
ncbi:MAG: ECF transporter S component [Eubacterium sp.]|nr:ECF transporter S component [Eubacterium sp.]